MSCTTDNLLTDRTWLLLRAGTYPDQNQQLAVKTEGKSEWIIYIVAHGIYRNGFYALGSVELLSEKKAQSIKVVNKLKWETSTELNYCDTF